MDDETLYAIRAAVREWVKQHERKNSLGGEKIDYLSSSAAQVYRALLFVNLKALGFERNDRVGQLEFLSELFGMPFCSRNELTVAQVRALSTARAAFGPDLQGFSESFRSLSAEQT